MAVERYPTPLPPHPKYLLCYRWDIRYHTLGNGKLKSDPETVAAIGELKEWTRRQIVDRDLDFVLELHDTPIKSYPVDGWNPVRIGFSLYDFQLNRAMRMKLDHYVKYFGKGSKPLDYVCCMTHRPEKRPLAFDSVAVDMFHNPRYSLKELAYGVIEDICKYLGEEYYRKRDNSAYGRVRQ